MVQVVDIANVVFAVTIAGLAGYQLADTWIVGSIFRRAQTWLKERKKTSLLAELLSCPFCLSHWTTLSCLLVLLLTGWDSLLRIPIYWFAAVKVAMLFQREEEIELDETAAVDDIEVTDESP